MTWRMSGTNKLIYAPSVPLSHENLMHQWYRFVLMAVAPKHDIQRKIWHRYTFVDVLLGIKQYFNGFYVFSI
jgi:hypothetical protein